ncbi:MAG: MFS transporter [Chloroflexi bacterium]|nr:MFS transporter [Chloroflexota bacterium]
MKDRSSILGWATACLFLTTFAFSAYSVFLPSLLQEFNSSRADATMPFAIAMFFWGALQPISGALADSRGTRPVILMGVFLMAMGFIAMGFSQTLWQISLGFGLLVGVATSACGSITFSLLVSKWFPGSRRASAVGLLQGAQPLSPMILAPVVFIVITTLGWRTAAVGLGLLLLLVGLPIAYFKLNDPKGEASYGSTAPARSGWQEIKGMMQYPALRNLFIARFACGLSFMLIPNLATAAIAAGLSETEGALAVSLYGAAGAVGSLAAGYVADRWGRVPTLVTTYLVRGFGSIILALFTMNNPVLFFLAVILAAGPIFGTVSINNVQAFELTKAKNAGFILGIGFVLHQVAASIGPYASGIAFDLTGTYRWAFLALGVVLILATIPASRTGEAKPAAYAKATTQALDAS